MSPPTPLMYNHPYVSHPYSNIQQPLPFENHFCASATPSCSSLQTPPQYAPSCSPCAVSTSVDSMMSKDFTVCFKFEKCECVFCHQNFLHSDEVVIKHKEF